MSRFDLDYTQLSESQEAKDTRQDGDGRTLLRGGTSGHHRGGGAACGGGSRGSGGGVCGGHGYGRRLQRLGRVDGAILRHDVGGVLGNSLGGANGDFNGGVLLDGAVDGDDLLVWVLAEVEIHTKSAKGESW